MRTLLLTSSGTQVKKEILKILPKPPSYLKIAHIITATNPIGRAPWKDKDERVLKEMGFQIELLDIEGKTKPELEKLLADKDIIFVQGGDPYYLLNQVKKTGFDKVSKRLINNGVIYISVSAGTYIACPTMEMALWRKPNRPRYGLADNEPCMNLIPFLISVHYESKFKTAVKQGIKNTKYPVKILTDDQAILVKGNKIQIVGKGKEIKL